MTVALELIAQGDEWLYISTTADHLDDDVEWKVPWAVDGRVIEELVG